MPAVSTGVGFVYVLRLELRTVRDHDALDAFARIERIIGKAHLLIDLRAVQRIEPAAIAVLRLYTMRQRSAGKRTGLLCADPDMMIAVDQWRVTPHVSDCEDLLAFLLLSAD